MTNMHSRPPQSKPPISNSDPLTAIPTSTGELVLNKQQLTALNKILDTVKNRVDYVMNASRTLGKELTTRLADRRRNIEKECGHPDSSQLTAEFYQELYDRDPIAARVIEVWPKECWQRNPIIYEDEDENIETNFERSLRELCNNLGGNNYHKEDRGSLLWEILQRLDIQCGIGRYGILFIGIDDGLDPRYPVQGWSETHPDSDSNYVEGLGEPYNPPISYNPYPDPIVAPTVKPTVSKKSTSKAKSLEDTPSLDKDGKPISSSYTPPKRKVMYLQVYPETMAKVVRWETNKAHPRYGQPVQYMLSTGIPEDSSTESAASEGTVVHWSRVIHVADNTNNSNKTLGMPRCQQVLNRILDLKKLYGGSAEMYWLGALPAIIFKTDPSLGGDVDLNITQLKDQIERLMNGLQRYASLNGMDAQALSPTVVDPRPQIEIQIEAICIKIKVPIRMFKGSERGELSSSQDSVTHAKEIRGRDDRFTTPSIVCALINRLIELEALIPPDEEEGYKVWWPDPECQSNIEKATVAKTLVEALVAFVQGNVSSVVPPMYLLTNLMGGFFTRGEAETMLEEAEAIVAEQEAKEKEEQAQQEELQHTRAMELQQVKDKSKESAISLNTSNVNKEPPTPIVVNNTLPQNITIHTPQIVNEIPDNPINHTINPVINVSVPPNEIPDIIVQAPNVTVQPPNIVVEAPNVNVESPNITNEITVQPSSISEVKILQDKPLNIKVQEAPEKTKVVKIEKTAEGKYKGTVEEKND